MIILKIISFIGTLPESPPDSGSEMPYSPTDLHAISNLNNSPTSSTQNWRYSSIIHRDDSTQLSHKSHDDAE